MVNFKRMKDELDDLGAQVRSRVPVVGKTGCTTIVLITIFLLFLIGFAIGYGTHRTTSSNADSLRQQPNYVFVSNTSGSCPSLKAERLLTTMEDGDSFEGLIVNLACRGDYVVFPQTIKCRRKSSIDSTLEWSHLPVCYPSVLVSKTHWTKTLHARSVSCTGDSQGTYCQLSCIRDYIAVERNPYSCTRPPCHAWSLGDAQCFMCDQTCARLHAVGNPRSDSLLTALNCFDACDRVIVNSNGPAAVWQNKRTGLFKFMGEHNGRPVYQNNATKEFLFYTFVGSEWLVGPDFRKPHAGIQVFGNDDTQCPERSGGKNVSRLYIDSSQPSPGGTGKWTPDDTLSFECMTDQYTPVSCKCRKYKLFNLVYHNDTVPDAVTLFLGTFERINEKEVGLLAPLYFDKVKQLFLFSHHPQGKVWQVSTKLSTTPVRAVFPGNSACPDSKPDVTWEWFNTTTTEGQQLYVKDTHIRIKCVDNFS